MFDLQKLIYLNEALLCEMPQYKKQAEVFATTHDEQKRLLRSLINVRAPMPLSDDFLRTHNEFLKHELAQKGVINIDDLESAPAHENIYLWQGDITRLRVDAIVNAANSALLGCFIPCHACIDNAIHFAAGPQLRQECQEIMSKQGCEEPTGAAKITRAYNLPCQYVMHTVGPIIHGKLKKSDCDFLRSCYDSCLRLAINKGLSSIAFCCISTGEFCFPNDVAAKIAVETVTDILNERKNGIVSENLIKNTFEKTSNNKIKVIFNVFKNKDLDLYKKLLY